MSDAPDKEPKTAPPIKLINRTRRPVCFRAAGKTVRLGPGEQSAELVAHCASVPGVRTLCARGTLGLVTLPRKTESEGGSATAAITGTAESEGPDNKQSADDRTVADESEKKLKTRHGKSQE